MNFVVATANLIAETLGIPQYRNDEEIASKAAISEVPPYVPKAIKVTLPGEEAKAKEEASPEDEEILANTVKELDVENLGVSSKDFHPIEFEKDDDTNFHISFIHAAANIRARNYKIVECDQQKTKMIAGRIIPAIATTTAMITGCVATEIYKFV